MEEKAWEALMNLLAIDTSTPRASVALAYQGRITERTQDNLSQHTQFLLPMIDDLLKEAGIFLEALSGIVFGQGPGSFTGLRIACSVAKALAYAHDLPLFPVNSLLSIAHQAGFERRSVLALMDARMQQVYWAFYPHLSSNVGENLSFTSAIELPGTETIVLAGLGFQSYEHELKPSVLARIETRMELYPSAVSMLALAEKITPIKPDLVLPLYLRNQVVHGVSNG